MYLHMIQYFLDVFRVHTVFFLWYILCSSFGSDTQKMVIIILKMELILFLKLIFYLKKGLGKVVLVSYAMFFLVS